jgi:acyl-CoA reductase-like NAD-dependent aldehyde dehydrogenase
MYGLAAAVFTQDISRALKVAHDLKAGTVWVRKTVLKVSVVTDLMCSFVGQLL